MKRSKISDFLSREKQEWEAVEDLYKKLGLMQVHTSITAVFDESLRRHSCHETAAVESQIEQSSTDEDAFRISS